jgi:hypothetical protein
MVYDIDSTLLASVSARLDSLSHHDVAAGHRYPDALLAYIGSERPASI